MSNLEHEIGTLTAEKYLSSQVAFNNKMFPIGNFCGKFRSAAADYRPAKFCAEPPQCV